MANQKKPATILRSAGLKATVWENQGMKGPFYSVTFARPYRTAEGNWQNASNFGLYELEALMNLAFEAREWLAAHPPRL
ncbi:MAG: hypothetical protein AB7S78_14130 [Candidatus Omnitrophota bacterium]